MAVFLLSTSSFGRGRSTELKTSLFIAIGALVALTGAVWTLQGLGYLGGSAMSGERLWAVVGPVVVLGGIALVVAGVRAPRTPRPKR